MGDQGWRSGQRDDFTFSEARHVLWSRRRLVLGTVIVFVIASVVYSSLQERVYTAEATIMVTPQGGSSPDQDTESFLQGVQGTVSTDELLAEATRQARVRADGRAGRQADVDFEQRLEVSQFIRQDSQKAGFLVSFSASGAQEAARGANAYADLFVQRVGDLNDRLAGGTLAAEADVERGAQEPGWPSSPRPLLYGALALVAGVATGGGGALLLDTRTRNWRGARDAEMTLRAPVLGVIPEYAQDGEEG
ncbi:MAG: Wzz/FepE/Etk N-terminal domain-containing protein [Rubrobacteraceae bacterium]